MITLRKEFEMDTREMRYVYCDALIELARQDDRIVAVNCDLGSSCGTKAFGEAFPQRSINVGIQEADGCSISAGLSAAGFIPFFHSFAVFSTRRICDQVFISCAYAGRNVKIIGSDAGISATANGGTHMAFEDIAIMRAIPTVTVVEPSDAVMMRALVPQIAHTQGVVYMRMPRKQVARLYEEGSTFQLGRGALLREGSDITLIASGMTVVEALKAAALLQEQGIGTRVIDMHTIKPLDEALVLESAVKTGAVITVENHNIIGGLGSAVAEVLGEQRPTPLERVGVCDEFGEVGPENYLRQRFGLTAAHIEKAAQRVLARKRA